MKSLLNLAAHAILSALSAFSNLALGARAEFGPQETYPGLAAASDLSAHQWLVVRMSAVGKVDVCSNAASAAAAQRAIGVLQNNPSSLQAATVAFLGLSKVKGGGTVTAGAYVAPNGSGRIVNATSGQIAIGVAMETLANDGEIGTVMLIPPVRCGSVA